MIRSRQGDGLLDVHNWRTRVWEPACAGAGVKTTPYDLRHSYASLLIHDGRPVVYVAAMMGHSSSSTTLDHYAHIYAEAEHARATRMVDAIAAARQSVPVRCPEATIRRLRDTSSMA